MTLQLLIALLPMLALVAALVAGRYPGEERLVRVRRRYLSRLVAWAGVTPPIPRLRPRSRRAPGRLLAFRLAGRAPPAVR
jgi:hypothetical protein